MRPIDADALDDLLAQQIKTLAPVPTRKEEAFLAMRMALACAPTIECNPVKQMSWIVQDETYTRFQCGSCKSKNFERTWSFCPLCGAQWNGKGQRRHEDDEA